MSTTEHYFDRIAHHFYEANKETMALEDVLKALDIWNFEATKEAMRAAMAIRGVVYKDGELHRAHDAAPTDPPQADFAPFVRAAVAAVDMATKPLPVGDLLSMSGLVSEAIPADGLASHLRAAGIFFIPGAGYWKHPQYATERGDLLTSPSKSRATTRIMDMFREHGWPLSGEDIARLSGNEVTSRFVTILAAQPQKKAVTSVGAGLFVPAGAIATAAKPIPMTRAMIERVLDQNPSEPIFRADNVTLYKLASVLARHGLAKVREGWKMRSGRHQRVAYIELTEEGYESFKGNDRRLKRDEF